MRDARHALADEWAKVGRPPLAARTGINSGLMLVGNYGSKYRFNYSVLGDQVNLASRLEQLGKAYGIEIMIGEGTAELIGNEFLLRELDKRAGQGAQAGAADLRASRRARARCCRRAQAADAERSTRVRWTPTAAGAGTRRRRCSRSAWRCGRQDGPSRVDARSAARAMREAPLPEDWDGSFEHLTKG